MAHPTPANGHAAPHANGSATERTPLLNGDNSVPQDEEQTVVVEEIRGSKLYLILGTCYVGVFLGAIDATIIATLSAPIASEFKSLSLLSWLATAYLIANAACQPISGRLTDIFGRGPGLVFSNVFFAAGNLVCGLARDEGSMIAGRVIAGIGGGGLMAISTFTASDLVPLRNRGVIQGVGNICYAGGAMLGGLVGGLINDRTEMGWRLAFLLQVPPVLVSACLVAYLVRIPPKISDKGYLARIDFVGVFSLITFLVLLLLGLNAGGNIVPWSHPLILATLPLSVVALLCFIFWESRHKQPVIPVRLLLDRTVGMACMTNFLCTMVNFSIMFFVPYYLQVNGNSATQAGLVLLFGPIGVSFSSVGAGLIMKRTGKYLALGMISVSLQVIATIILVTLDEHTPKWHLMLAHLLLGAGMGAMLTVTLLACLAAVDHSQQAVITSATYAFRSVGSTLGITVSSAVYQNVLLQQLWGRFGDLPGAADEIQRIRDDIGEVRHLPPGWRDGVIASYMEAFRSVWFLVMALAVAALVAVSLLRQHKLHSTMARTDEDGNDVEEAARE
ncbi:major facilitator superfamily transporter [Microdochium trichocladiopsis]|uniref:Major facilitator superfamily transporter n=1 Tax=Microdochium trichocladiopsis TaxID=1682393 RepID=A0A9P9BPJ2_9PEZI|nr:major facilitator superfamily transporter [Microdochium trichocladiopsis]KAH7033189.1 major facilitator superfamily transporter [Microdochium trichocladiopsis]